MFDQQFNCWSNTKRSKENTVTKPIDTALARFQAGFA